MFFTKKEVFVWVKNGEKTVDVRKGRPRKGETAVFLSGYGRALRLPIIKKETGRLVEVVRADNFKSVIPQAKTLADALNYIRSLYDYNDDGVFTAYYLGISYAKQPEVE